MIFTDYTAMKKLGRKKPQKVIKRPINQALALFYDLANSRRFEIAIFVLIFLNMLSMGIEHYNQPNAIFFILEVSNAFFTTVFSLECIVKIIGLRYHYFTVPWNVFDFLLVLASIFGILMEDIMIDLPISPTLLRVVRVFRIGRILRLIKVCSHNNCFQHVSILNNIKITGRKRHQEAVICFSCFFTSIIQYRSIVSTDHIHLW